MRLRRALVVSVIVLLPIVAASCSWLPWVGRQAAPDPITLAHLETIQADGAVHPDSCQSYIAYERSKQASNSAMFDKKSLSDLEKICNCFRDANPNVVLEVDACKAMVTVAIAHEKNKQ